MTYDVVIAGAGPAGVATALALLGRDPSLAGRMLLVDRATFPRDKPCGGGLTGHADEAMAALKLELTVPSLPSPRAEVRFWDWQRRVQLGRPVRVVRRHEFDASLVAQARDRGVVIRQGAALHDFTVDQDGVDVDLVSEAGAPERLRARVLVGADGVGSRVRKRLTNDADGRPIRLFRLEIPARGPVDDVMLYDFSPMSEGLRGYLWIFPMPGDRLNVGLMHDPSLPQSGAQLTALLDRHLARLGVTLPKPARGWPAFGYTPSTPVSAPRLITVGDAAGIDALTGEGIAVGMEQALVAGEVIARAFDSGDFSFASYPRALRRSTVGRELALDRWLARLLYRGDWQRWLSLVLHDERMLELYAARVSGSLVLADHKRELVWALLRHALRGRGRRRQLLADQGSDVTAASARSTRSRASGSSTSAPKQT